LLKKHGILSTKNGNVIARNVFCDEAIPWITPGDYEPKKQASAKTASQ
jgi:hypothetical protein